MTAVAQPKTQPMRQRWWQVLRRDAGDTITMFVVTTFSLLLLVYVGYGEGSRTYAELHAGKVRAQGEIVRNSMESYLRNGLPLRQFVGFGPLTESIVDSEDILAIRALDQSGKEAFANIDKTLKSKPPAPLIQAPITHPTVVEAGDYYHIVLPLRSRFEAAGYLVMTSARSIATGRVWSTFVPMFKVPFLLSAVFALFIVATRARLARQRFPWLQVAYAATFVGMSTMVISTLATLYAQAVQDKAIAVADTLGGRINDIVAADLALQDFSGLDKAFADYQRLGADISNAALISDGRVMIHTNPDRVGKPWRADPASYEYFVKLGSSTHNADVSIALSVPRDVVYRQVGRSVKNFLALFVASAFLAGLFLQVAVSLKNSGRDKALTSAGLVAAENEAALTAVKPLFFVAVFLEHMTYSFLPQYMQGLAAASGASTAFASMPFMMYYLFFALALIPSGYLAQNIGPRALMNVGLLLCGVGLVALLLPIDLWIAIGARAISGIGQGMLFIGVQSYILASASPERRTQGNAIIVFGFQGGMISGMAIGSLLVIYMGEKGVFELAAVLAMVTALYGFILVPDAPARALAFSSLSQTMSRLVQDLRCVVRNGQFMRTMLLVGIPAKATLTGIITFALPLMLSQQEYKQEDIGQIIMLYALGVVLASHYVARLVDRIGQTSRILSWGAAAAGVGTLIVGLSNLGPHGGGAAFGGNLPTMVLIAGVIVIGMAHGCINAPVVTHVAELGLTRAIGVDSTTATYRFLERIGHVMGPIIVGQMFLASGTSPTAIAWFGATTAFLGIVFLLGASLNPGGTGTSERIA